MPNNITLRLSKSGGIFDSFTAGIDSTKVGESMDEWLGDIIAPKLPTTGDIAYALLHQKTRILERTAQGLDYQGNSFEPYNTTRAYYYYAPSVVRQRTAKAASRERNRLHKLIGKGERSGTTGIKFANYAEFKRAFNSSVVNLMGVDSPNMLGQIELRVNGSSFTVDAIGGSHASSLTSPASGLITIGIYDTVSDKGKLAAAHNRGLGHQPRREFFAVSRSDMDDILHDVYTRIRSRQ